MADFHLIVMAEGASCLLSATFDENELIQQLIQLILLRSALVPVYEMKESSIPFCFA